MFMSVQFSREEKSRSRTASLDDHSGGFYTPILPTSSHDTVGSVSGHYIPPHPQPMYGAPAPHAPLGYGYPTQYHSPYSSVYSGYQPAPYAVPYSPVVPPQATHSMFTHYYPSGGFPQTDLGAVDPAALSLVEGYPPPAATLMRLSIHTPPDAAPGNSSIGMGPMIHPPQPSIAKQVQGMRA